MTAAVVGPSDPFARQLTHWFWRETVAGQMLIVLRDKGLGVPAKEKFALVAGCFLVRHE